MDASFEKTALKKRLGKGLERLLLKSRRTYTPTDTLAHELGHIKTFNKGPKSLTKARMMAYSHAPGVASLASLFAKGKPGKFNTKASLITAAGYAPRLTEEALATYHGLKAMKTLKYISPTMYNRARKNLALAYGTYLNQALTSTVVAGAGNLGNLTATERLLANKIAPAIISGQVNKALMGSLKKGTGFGGLSNRRQRRALVKAMGVDPRLIHARGGSIHGGGAIPRGLLTIKSTKKKDKWLKEGFRDVGAIIVPKARKPAYTGKRNRIDKALDSLEAFAKDLQK